MDAIWEQLCLGYVNDTLSPMQRKQVEQRIASGDPEILHILENMTGFPQEKIRKAATENRIKEETKDKDDLKNYIAASASSQKSSEEKPQAKGQEAKPKSADIPSYSKIGQWITRIAAVIAIAAILGLMYTQWFLQVNERKIEQLTKQEADLQTTISALNRRIQGLSLENNRIKSTLPSDFSYLLQVPARDQSHFFKKAYLMIDLSTQRTLGMIKMDSLPSTVQLQFWIQNKYREWNHFGSIENFNPDSLYMSFRGEALTHGRVLEIHETPRNLEEPVYGEGIRLARLNLP